MAPNDSSSGKATELLDWLVSAPPAELGDEIAQLRARLIDLASPEIAPPQQHRCIELFAGRALRMAGELQPQLVRSGLPLNRDQHTAARQLCEALLTIAESFLDTIAAARRGEILAQRHLAGTLAGRGLRMLFEAQKIHGLAGGGQIEGIWGCAQALLSAGQIGGATVSADDPPDSAPLALRQVLAFGALQIESFSQSELSWICAWLGRAAALIEIATGAPALPSPDAFWFSANTPPQPISRRPPPVEGEKLFFSTAPLARQISDHLAQLDAGQHPAALPAPPPEVQPRLLLRRVLGEWQHAAKRETPRHEARYRVQACAGLAAIWKVLRGSADASLIHEWQVLNESQGGYSILHVATRIDGLCAGTAIALRPNPRSPWTLCIVRWIRCDQPQQIELGLQSLSTGASPVGVGFRGGDKTKMVDALVLPAAANLRPQPAILAPAGTYTSRRFALVSDTDRLYVAQGRLLSLDMQTACVELFQFEIDPYPI